MKLYELPEELPEIRELYGDHCHVEVALRVEDRAHDAARVAHELAEEVEEQEAAEDPTRRGCRTSGPKSPQRSRGFR